MNDFSIQRFVSLHALGAAGRRSALEQIAEAASTVRPAIPGLSAALDEALAHERTVLRLHGEEAPTGTEGLDAGRLARRIETLLIVLHGKLQLTARSFPAPAPEGVHAQALLDALFPVGVGRLTQRPLPEQQEATHALLVRAAQPEAAGRLQELGHVGTLRELQALCQALGHALCASTPPNSAVHRAEQRGSANLAAVVARILGQFPSDGADHVAARQALLAPLVRLQREAPKPSGFLL